MIATFLLEKVSKVLISRNISLERENFCFFNTVASEERTGLEHYFYGKINIFPPNQSFSKEVTRELISRKMFEHERDRVL